MVVDLGAFDANAHDLVRRAGGKPVRLASKSVRVPALIRRALAPEGFAGVLGYTLSEALWLVEQGLTDDVVLGYPTVDRDALRRLTASEEAFAAITLMVDDVAQLDLVDACRTSEPRSGSPSTSTPACVSAPRTSVPGARRCTRPRRCSGSSGSLLGRPGFRLVGVMTYEGQVAGVPDDVPTQRARSVVVRRIKAASMRQLADRRAELSARLRALVELEFWNAGGTGLARGDRRRPRGDRARRRLRACSPRHCSTTTPASRSLPATFFGVPVVRRPAQDVVTVAGGGFVASGAAGKDRLPMPWAPSGLALTGLEGAGEVQTPLVGPAATATPTWATGSGSGTRRPGSSPSTPRPCTCSPGSRSGSRPRCRPTAASAWPGEPRR